MPRPPHGTHPVDYEADAALMRRIASGDKTAGRELMERSLGQVLAIGRRILRDPVEAEDVAQDTFIRAWKAAPDWQPGQAKLESWMCRIATNLCLDRLRKKREALMESPPELRDGAVTAVDALIASETGLCVMAAIAALPERQRLALELCHFQDYSNIEAADKLEISVDALESLLARGRRKLKAKLMPQREELMSSLSEAAGSTPEVM
ncbi:RNA polymerase sigma factor [Hyphobacterium indicum]|uniref:RNA polymerase sigma factor n=1 Tax=Hyphobacterium indicum TaxID=2162714 RepID=UPI000D652C11|nr:RNA polymerase sigma factor [Hyphobacterium indicum]